jgi:hypothetical protein
MLHLAMSGGANSYGIISFTAFAGHWYDLQASTDLKNWTSIWQTSTAGSTASVSYSDVPAGAPYQKRFYRYVQH